jgi:mercuric ion transport protein
MNANHPEITDGSTPPTGLRALIAGGAAALLASTCCLGPLVLITLGFSGAWISKLTVLEPYQPIFITAAVVALFFAWKRIWRPASACAPGEVCALPRVRRGYQLLFVAVCGLVLLALAFPLVAPWFY